MVIFAQINQNLLNATGVIATILSVIFGVAAFYNSRTRKKHMEELERSQKQEHAIHFRPAKSTAPASRSSVPGRPSKPHQSNSAYFSDPGASPAPKAAPVAKPVPDLDRIAESSQNKSGGRSFSKESPALFRKVKPSGSVNSDSVSDADDKNDYVWE